VYKTVLSEYSRVSRDDRSKFHRQTPDNRNSGNDRNLVLLRPVNRDSYMQRSTFYIDERTVTFRDELEAGFGFSPDITLSG